MSHNTNSRRPLDNRMADICSLIEAGNVTSFRLNEQQTRKLQQRLRCLRNQRDQFVYEMNIIEQQTLEDIEFSTADQTEQSAMYGDLQLTLDSFRMMAVECNNKMRRIRNALSA